MHCLCLFTAPDGPPRSLMQCQGFPTSIELEWLSPTLEHQNGVILGYQVSWKLYGSEDVLLGTKNVTSNYTTIGDLNISTVYEVAVSAFTVVGIGPSASITVRTTNRKSPADCGGFYSWLDTVIITV